MSYKKIGWVSGETPLSATNFNHMEEGISTIDSAVGTDAYDSTKAYSKGDYFIYNDSLCKAIADIAAGAELLSGVNYSTTTVHEELTELNSNLFNILPEKQLHASGDLNDLTQGFYRCIETPHNVPPVSLTGGFTNDYGRVVVFGYTDYRIQIFFNSWGNYIAWRRCSTSSGWSDWMLV